MVVFLTAQWRGWATPWALDPDIVATNLERFGKESLVYTRAYTACPAVEKGRESLLKGQFPPFTEDAESPVIATVTGVPAALEFLDKNRANRFLLVVDAPLPASAPSRFNPAHMHPRQNVPSEKEATVRAELARYYSSLAALDAEFGKLLAGIATLKLADEAMVLFTSDRGAQLGSHGLDGDDAPYEESIRVPLAIRYPGNHDAGTATDSLLSLVELRPLMDNQVRRVPAAPSIYVKGALGKKDEFRVVVRGYDKLVFSFSGSTIQVAHLFNLADDPYELTNLAQEPAARLTRDSLTATAQSWMRRLGDRVDPSGLKKRK